jgi:hypothetical protein
MILLNLASITKPIRCRIGLVIEAKFNKSVILRVRLVGPAISALFGCICFRHYTLFLHPLGDAALFHEALESIMSYLFSSEN